MMVQFMNAQQEEQRVSASPSTLSPRSPLALNLPPRQSESPVYSLISVSSGGRDRQVKIITLIVI